MIAVIEKLRLRLTTSSAGNKRSSDDSNNSRVKREAEAKTSFPRDLESLFPR